VVPWNHKRRQLQRSKQALESPVARPTAIFTQITGYQNRINATKLSLDVVQPRYHSRQWRAGIEQTGHQFTFSHKVSVRKL
jgi:predicted nicotinamide N-methyase